MTTERQPRTIPNPFWCDRSEGRGYLVTDAEWEPYAVQCPDCREHRAALGAQVMTRDYNPLDHDSVVIAGLEAEVERLTALVKDALRGLHNDFEPDNQSALYNRIKAALEPKP